MTEKHFLKVIDTYRSKLYGLGYKPVESQLNVSPNQTEKAVNHCMWMLYHMPNFIKAGELDKVNRWLGFIQGTLNSAGIYTVDEMRDHNRAPND